MKDVLLRGIVVAGNTRAEAEENYRAVATGVSVLPLIDKDRSFMILSKAEQDVTLMNPLTGVANLEKTADDAVGRMKFLASDSEEEINTFYTICSDGCGSHIIADDPELVKRCVLCSAELKDLSEDDLNALSGSADETDKSDSNSEPNAISVCASTREEAIEKFRAIAANEVPVAAYDCEHGVVVSGANEPFSYSPYTSESAVAIEDEEGIQLTVEASNLESVEAHWFVCAGDECGMHTITTCESSVFCANCSSGLIEPEELEASDSEESDEVKPEVTAGDCCDDCGSDPCECEDDEDEDEDDSDEDDDDDSDDEEEEDEESDDEDEDEEEDMDDDNSLSVSSVDIESESEVPNAEETTQASTEAPAAEDTAADSEEAKASDESAEETEGSTSTASEEAEEEKTMTSIATDMLAIASAKGELESKKLHVSFCGSVDGKDTWVAFYEGTPVAQASSTDAPEDKADIFSTSVYGQLVLASAKENGVSEALSELGFKSIATTVSVDDFVKDEIAEQVAAQISEAKSQYESQSSDYTQRFLAALATAGQGINKNFFKDVTNPVKGALVSTLTSLGIQGAEKVVASAFVKHNDAFLQALVAKASEIMEYDVNVQNQLNDVVATAADANVSESSSSTDDSFLSIGKPVVSPAKKVEKPFEAKASTQPDMDAVLSTLVKRR